MSTSRAPQFLDVADADGNALSGQESNRREFERFKAGGAIAIGDWVEFDRSQTGAARVAYAIEAPAVATVGNARAFGVSLDAATGAAGAEETVRVVTAGYAGVASVLGGVGSGVALCGPITVAGRAEPATAATLRVCGHTLGAEVGGFAPVCVYKAF